MPVVGEHSQLTRPQRPHERSYVGILAHLGHHLRSAEFWPFLGDRLRGRGDVGRLTREPGQQFVVALAASASAAQRRDR